MGIKWLGYFNNVFKKYEYIFIKPLKLENLCLKQFFKYFLSF